MWGGGKMADYVCSAVLTASSQSSRCAPPTIEADHTAKPHTPICLITWIQLAHVLGGWGAGHRQVRTQV